MKKVKKYIIGYILFLVIAGIAVVPLVFSYFSDQVIFNKVYTSRDRLNDEKGDSNSNMTTEEKLMLITGFRNQDSEIIFVESNQTAMPSEAFGARAIEEMKKLKTLGVLPGLDLDKEFKIVGHSIINIFNKENEQESVAIWAATFSFEDYIIYIWMDLDSYKIYEFNVFMERGITGTIEYPNIEQVLSYLELQTKDNERVAYLDRGAIYSFNKGRILYRYVYTKQYVFWSITENKVLQDSFE